MQLGIYVLLFLLSHVWPSNRFHFLLLLHPLGCLVAPSALQHKLLTLLWAAPTAYVCICAHLYPHRWWPTTSTAQTETSQIHILVRSCSAFLLLLREKLKSLWTHWLYFLSSNSSINQPKPDPSSPLLRIILHTERLIAQTDGHNFSPSVDTRITSELLKHLLRHIRVLSLFPVAPL